jgi:hypothetical protein
MAAGKVPTTDDLNNQLYFAAVGLREAVGKVQNLWDYVRPLGSAGLQGPPWNMDPADADDYFAAAEYASTVAAVYHGLAAQPSAFNFDDALAPVRGGG